MESPTIVQPLERGCLSDFIQPSLTLKAQEVSPELPRRFHGPCMRSYDKAQEEEAFGVGAAALIPWNALFPAITKGATIEELAERYELSDQLVRYRIQITGAYKLHMARQRVGH